MRAYILHICFFFAFCIQFQTSQSRMSRACDSATQDRAGHQVQISLKTEGCSGVALARIWRTLSSLVLSWLSFGAHRHPADGAELFHRACPRMSFADAAHVRAVRFGTYCRFGDNSKMTPPIWCTKQPKSQPHLVMPSLATLPLVAPSEGFW